MRGEKQEGRERNKSENKLKGLEVSLSEKIASAATA
jgi:hypothetical protein